MELLSADSLLPRRAAPRRVFALWEAGFRPFFLLAGVAGAGLMAVWALTYAGVAVPPLAGLAPALWHGHEMVFGFAGAVIAGFLLTAARNWTSKPTASPRELGVSVAAWAVARSVPLVVGGGGLPVMAAADLVFMLVVMVTIARPIVQVRQWRQLGVLGVLTSLAAVNVVFYEAAWRGDFTNARLASIAGAYLVMLMVHVIGARVLPFFVERGAPEAAPVHEPKALKLAVPASFALYAALDVGVLGAAPRSMPALGVVSVVLGVATTWRLACWMRPGALRRPMLAVLLLAYAAFPVGAALRAAAVWGGVPSTLAFHAMLVGGAGAMILGMMARVALGHTGRNIYAPPRGTAVAFALVAVAFAFRVLMPLVSPARYADCVLVAQLAWIAAFVLFVARFAGLLLGPRADGKPG